ncbi:uncharacterized protein F5147DRAFT_644269 [Suillus discolor]|uniref:Uncharacterized protein n=1 Tax=Suillus discolor TaxID=1912936 RepID=A0A9P7JM31_9AGAM|nr:uncharacterized protein F5147DRAFT_644269 [Suillus discolor]KAG2087819.1 hypothetical protein F5147DRAFT_644269 [Suillus discolor]
MLSSDNRSTPRSSGTANQHSPLSAYRMSRLPSQSGALVNSVWNSRGWTIQEFLAFSSSRKIGEPQGVCQRHAGVRRCNSADFRSITRGV